MIDVSVIIVSYNTEKILKDCIESVYAFTKDVSFEVIICDNASTDGTASEISKLKSQFANLKLIENKQNLGFSKANNLGVKQAQGKYLLFLNPDTLFKENTLRVMFDFMEQTADCGASTCKVMLTNGKLDDSCHRGFPTPWNAFTHFSGISKLFPKSKIFNGYNLGNLNLNEIHKIDALAGSFMFVRKTAGDEAKWWDEDYFFYGEDLDFCFVLKSKRWKIYYVPQTSIVHLKGVSGGIKNISKEITTADKKTKKLATYHRFNAMKIFYKKHYTDKYPWIVTKIVYLGISLKQLLS